MGLLMRRPLHALLVALPLGAVVLLGARCFQPALPDCAYRCGSDEPRCPPEYECRDDGYCHRRGTTTLCPFTMDLATPADLRPPADLVDASTGDLADGGAGDAGDFSGAD